MVEEFFGENETKNKWGGFFSLYCWIDLFWKTGGLYSKTEVGTGGKRVKKTNKKGKGGGFCSKTQNKRAGRKNKTEWKRRERGGGGGEEEKKKEGGRKGKEGEGGHGKGGGGGRLFEKKEQWSISRPNTQKCGGGHNPTRGGTRNKISRGFGGGGPDWDVGLKGRIFLLLSVVGERYLEGGKNRGKNFFAACLWR